MIQLRDLGPSELFTQETELLDLWSASAPPTFRMDTRLWRQLIEVPLPAEERLCACIAREAERRRASGLVLFRKGDRPTVDALLIRPESRGRGLGRALLEAALERLDADCRPVRFGGGTYHLVPGLPALDAPSEGSDETPAARLFERVGFRPDWVAHDLFGRPSKVSKPGESYLEGSTTRLLGSADEGPLRGLLCEFGERWGRDTEWRLQGGPNWADREEIMGVFQDGKLAGFCHLWTHRSTRLGPSVFWLDRSRPGWAGIGPVGVAPEQRGSGLGGQLLDASLRHFSSLGVAAVGVDWTSVPHFYATRGFEIARSYRGYLKTPNGEPAATLPTEGLTG